MAENIDLTRFLDGVQNELDLLTIPREHIEEQLQERFDDKRRVVEEYESGLMGPGRRVLRRLSEKEWDEKLQRELYGNYKLMLSQLIVLEPDNQEWHREQERFSKNEKITPQKYGYLWEQRQKISEQKAKQLLVKDEVRTRFCQALKTVSNDSFEIAKIVTPLLIGLAAAGTISIPLMPVLFASIALVITRMSIAGLCADKSKKDEDKHN